MHSVIEIRGCSRLAISGFDNAAAAVVGMAANAGRSPAGLGGRRVGVTMLGQTTPGVMHLRDALERAGWETVIFQANGVGGPAMEALAQQGARAGGGDCALAELGRS